MSDTQPPPEDAYEDSHLQRTPHPVDKGKPFNPDPTRERNRTLLALGSFILFGVVILTFLFAVVFGERTWKDLEIAAAVLIPSVSTVASVAIAFFFSLEHARKG